MVGSYVGSHIVAMKRFDFKAYIERCAKIRATILRMVPSAVVSLVKEQWVRELDLKCVRYIMCSGAALPSHIVVRLHEIMGEAEIIQGYE